MKLNCDLGEGFGNWQLVDERTVMPHIDMANIACGFHAGDPVGIRHSVRLARECGVQIGAHPAYPDLVGFGRRSMDCAPEEITAMVLYQIGALRALCAAENTHVEYVKPHGALYNDMMRNDAVLRAILEAVAGAGGQLPLMLMATPRDDDYRKLAAEYSVPLLFEAFADRRYTPEGRLQPRSEAGAVLHDAGEILQQVRDLQRGQVTASDGSVIALAADSVCVHGDNPQGVATIVEIRRALGKD
ncbi:5-oxoprolinase subunit PxpA [Microbulbifer hainanensis]|uniref:5-oxoprolinase subunit PxpA n=1 Tax=Microbulbifer hainanensis TaxID=2735675 RepID=UPI0018673DC5|nr:5-oxoprolinase subunit PxpA [Microbulbifer hainanensis]